MKNHDLIAFYPSRDMAEHARDELLQVGFDHDDVKVYANDGRNTGGGFWDSIKEAFGFVDEQDKALYAEAARRGASAVAVSLDDDEGPTAGRALPIIQRFHPIDLDQQAATWRKEGWSGHMPSQQQTRTTTQTQTSAQAQQHRATGTASAATTQNVREGTTAIPVVQEELRVGKRRVEKGGVRIYNRVVQQPVEEKVNLREERVHVERRPVDRPATEADKAFQERAVEATAMKEEAVVDKKARVVEEVRLTKDANERTETVRDNVRRTDVQVEQTGAAHPGQSSAFAADTFASQLASDQRFHGRDWKTVEPDVRKTYEQRYGSGWERFKDEIHRSWDRVRSKV
jgi:uncharacterized protein (TIGR02271 family)